MPRLGGLKLCDRVAQALDVRLRAIRKEGSHTHLQLCTAVACNSNIMQYNKLVELEATPNNAQEAHSAHAHRQTASERSSAQLILLPSTFYQARARTTHKCIRTRLGKTQHNSHVSLPTRTCGMSTQHTAALGVGPKVAFWRHHMPCVRIGLTLGPLNAQHNSHSTITVFSHVRVLISLRSG